MGDLIVFLNDNQGLLTFSASLLTAAATVALVWVTAVLARETRVLAQRSGQPFIVCTLESGEGSANAMHQMIRNTGNATAFDIVVMFDPALPQPNKRGLNDPRMEVSLLAPGQRLNVDGVLSEDIVGQSFSVNVSWSDLPSGPKHNLSYIIRASDGFRAGWRIYGLDDIARHLDDIKQSLRKR